VKITTRELTDIVREELNKAVKEISTTGTGAGFTPGEGGQYSTPKAFKKQNKRTTEKET